MRLRVRSSAVPLAILGLGWFLFQTGCASSGSAPAPGAQSALPPAVSQALRQNTPLDPALVAADNGLGFSLANTLRAQGTGGNLIISPLSVALALDMAYAGAAGDTRQDMAAALKLGPVVQPEQANAALQAKLAPVDPGARLQVANSLWARPGVALPSFLALNQNYYGAFVGDLAGGPAAVNAWADQQTQGLIPALLAPDADCSAYDLLLVNTVCFRGSWSIPFQKELTAQGPFTRQGGTQVTVELMHRTGIMDYVRTPSFQAARLAYGTGRYGLLLILPAPGIDLGKVASGLDQASYQALVGSMDAAPVQLTLPRFSCSYVGQLQSALTTLGMGSAFDPARADFSAMATKPQAILAVVHRARIAVNEQGTLAAAGSAVEMAPTAVLGDPLPMALDRPFLVAITDRDTGTVVFLGQVLDPS